MGPVCPCVGVDTQTPVQWIIDVDRKETLHLQLGLLGILWRLETLRCPPPTTVPRLPISKTSTESTLSVYYFKFFTGPTNDRTSFSPTSLQGSPVYSVSVSPLSSSLSDLTVINHGVRGTRHDCCGHMSFWTYAVGCLFRHWGSLTLRPSLYGGPREPTTVFTQRKSSLGDPSDPWVPDFPPGGPVNKKKGEESREFKSIFFVVGCCYMNTR